MMILICLIVFIALIVGIISFIELLMDYTCNTGSNYPKIKFAAFKKFYTINPDRWNLDIASVVCKIVNEEYSPYRGLFHTYNSERFYFSFLDYLRYTIFRKQLEKDKLKAKHMEATSKMLGMVKKDIANMENLAEQQKKQAMENFDSILNNLGGTNGN